MYLHLRANSVFVFAFTLSNCSASASAPLHLISSPHAFAFAFRLRLPHLICSFLSFCLSRSRSLAHLPVYSLYRHYRIAKIVSRFVPRVRLYARTCVLHVCRSRFYLPLVKSAIFSAKKPTSINSKLWGAHNTRLRGNCASPWKLDISRDIQRRLYINHFVSRPD